MHTFPECEPLEQLISTRAQQRMVAKNAMVLCGSGPQFPRISKALQQAFQQWSGASQEYQAHKTTHSR
jgi:hypothetical protein